MGRLIDWVGKNETAAKIGASAIGGAIGMIGEGARYRRNLQGQKDLMALQYQNQMGLNQQGHNLQYDMWLKTNYPAQIEMMKKAGLNPALMYGQAGAGGSTGSQGGGSAASGSVPGVNMNDMLIGAQIAKLNADTENVKANTDKIADERKVLEAQFEKLLVDRDFQKEAIKTQVKETEKRMYEAILLRLNKEWQEKYDLTPNDSAMVKTLIRTKGELSKHLDLGLEEQVEDALKAMKEQEVLQKGKVYDYDKRLRD